MKQFRILVAAAALFIGTEYAAAQAKVAHINVQELMAAMPEVKAAEAQLKKVAETYDGEYKTMVTEFQTKRQKYEGEAATAGDAENEKRSKELQDFGQRIQQFGQTAEKEVGQKRADLYKPIMDKVTKSIQKIARAKGFQYVLDTTEGSGILLADGPNLLADVKKDLGF